MKQRSLLGVLAMGIVLNSIAQTHHGPRVGLGLATQSVGGLFQNTSNLMPAPVLGWGLDVHLHPQFSIMPELLWMTKGAVVRNQAQDTRSRTKLRYIELPVLVKVGTDAKPGGMFFTLGPSLGYFISGNYKSWLGSELVTDTQYDLSQSDNRWQFSAAVGLGFDQGRWTFEMRAQTSLTPFSATTNTQNIVYSFLFAWHFEIKKKIEGEPAEE